MRQGTHIYTSRTLRINNGPFHPKAHRVQKIIYFSFDILFIHYSYIIYDNDGYFVPDQPAEENGLLYISHNIYYEIINRRFDMHCAHISNNVKIMQHIISQMLFSHENISSNEKLPRIVPICLLC